MEFIPICSCWEGAGIAASDGTGDQPELHFGGHEPPFMAQLFSHGGMLCFALLCFRQREKQSRWSLQLFQSNNCSATKEKKTKERKED